MSQAAELTIIEPCGLDPSNLEPSGAVAHPLALHAERVEERQVQVGER
jgi:hypothetical protein